MRTAHAISYTLPIDDQLELYNEDDTEKLEKEQLLEKIKVLEDLKERDQLIIQLYYEELSLKGD